MKQMKRWHNFQFEKFIKTSESLYPLLFQMTKEKILLERRLTAATQKIVVEEERNRQNVKLKAKLEAKIIDYEQRNKELQKVSKVIPISSQKLSSYISS